MSSLKVFRDRQSTHDNARDIPLTVGGALSYTLRKLF